MTAPLSILPAISPHSSGAGQRTPEPTVMVIFGASGDLTQRKLLPALFTLTQEGLLPTGFAVIGYGRTALSDDAFRKLMLSGMEKFARRGPLDRDLWTRFARNLFYRQGPYDDPASFVALRSRIEEIERGFALPGNRVFYLSTPPSAFAQVVRNLGGSGLIPRVPESRFGSEKGSVATPFSRVIIEKPFGTDLATARALNQELHDTLAEKQIFRIDHYLGKETVQNLLVLRFANAIFEPIWNNRHVDHVQITGAETSGVEGRGGYFEQAGMLRDMVQNHLLQVASLAAMEPPSVFDADGVRDEKLKVLRALRPIARDQIAAQVVRAQYSAGSIGGRPVPGYRQESGVGPMSATETYVGLKFFIDSWRWMGVPFYLRSAKRMPKRVTEIAIHFKEAPRLLLGRRGKGGVRPNVLSIRIQPDEGITLDFGAKLPGPDMEVAPVSMDFRYRSSFGGGTPEAYERLILDCMLGDGTLFTRADEVEASWAWISKIQQAWEEGTSDGTNGDLTTYPAGSWGPAESDHLLSTTGHQWRSL